MHTSRYKQMSCEPSVLRVGTGSRSARALAAVMLLGFCATGCSCSGIAHEVAALKDSGRAVSSFTDTDSSGFGAKKGQAGTVDRLSVLLCEYTNSDAAASGQAATEAWGSDTATVVVLRRGSTLFAVADRNQSDPDGKNISALSRVFRGAKGR